MATPYEHEISFSWPDLDLANAAISPRMKEIFEFIGESNREYQQRLEKHNFAKKSAEHERRYGYPLQAPEAFLLDFTRIIPLPPQEKEPPPTAEEMELWEEELPEWAVKANKAAAVSEEDPHEAVEDTDRDWLMTNWGCYTNAEYVGWSPKYCMLTFETYGGDVTPIIATIHRKFPDVTILYNWRGPGDGVKGGCEFLARDDWDESAVSTRDAWLIERGMKQKGEMPKLEWEAEKPYNEWRMQF